MKAYITIKNKRLSKQVLQRDLSEKTFISQSYLSEIETNKKSPNLNQICRIAEALGVHPLELFYFKW